MMENFEQYRALFSITEQCVYMNHAAIGPLPRTAADRVRQMAGTLELRPDQSWVERLAEYERVRGLAARAIGTRADHEVAFVANTSDGLSVVAAGLDWREGDNVVGAACEFPSNVYPWMNLASKGVDYRQVPERDGRIDPDEVLAAVDERTRVVALSWVQFASGYRIDLARIGRFCRERDVLFVVDGIQGLGAIRLDVERDYVDVMAASAHKWLLGSEGIALLYVSDRIVDRLPPAHVGWTSVRDWIKWSRYDLTLREGAGRYERGTLNAFGLSALGASLELLFETGLDAVEARCRALSDRLALGLQDLGFFVVGPRADGEWSAIVAATHEQRAPQDLARYLADRNVVAAHRSGRLRISPHFYNTFEEIDTVLTHLSSAI